MRGKILNFISVPAVALLTALLALFILLPGQSVLAEDKPQTMVGGVTAEEAMRLGEKMYRQGILPSGEPMRATVKGDVPVDGKMFTCGSCHLRSGFGTTEGQARTPPIDGTRLYSPVSKFREVLQVGQAAVNMGGDLFRPAYTDESLAACIEGGVDPVNRQLNSIMPLYPLEKQDMAILVYYLKNFSVGHQPGVSETTLRFATVITEEVPKEAREAMLTPLQEFIDHWKVPARMERTVKGKSQRQEGGASRGLRTLALSVWELKGPSETWRGQLEEYYRNEPVFALLGGISTKEWAPIHQFCEDLRIPAIFPVTDLPVISETDWYTVYLSKGLYQEGETAAKFLHAKEGMAEGQAIVQVYRDGSAGAALAKGFGKTWEGLGHKTPDAVVLNDNEPLPADLWTKINQMHKQAVVLLWLNDRDFPDLSLLSKDQPRPALVMASTGMLGKKIYSLPESERSNLYLTYPYALPEEAKGYRAHFAAASTSAKVPLGQREPALKMNSLFPTVAGALSRLRSYVYRDYFLELIEATPNLESGQIIYSKLSFGTGQRYASKGCHVVQLGDGVKPKLLMRSAWVIH
jgi:hypothetical protein